MNEPASFPDGVSGPSPEQIASALFADLVLRQTQMALLFMGKAPHPQSGKPVLDLEQAQLAIDQLEMLELKTKGNLTADEASLLKQSLMTLRMAFVEAAEAAPAETEPGGEKKSSADGSKSAEPFAKTESAGAASQAEEPRKKFSKKY